MSKYTKTVAATPETDRPYVSKSLKTGLNNHTGFGNIDDCSLSLPIDPAEAAGYSPEVIALAGQLKYQHENGRSTPALPDSFYLKYAQRALNANYSSKFGGGLPGIDVAPDPHYAQYSYEEIITMANNGVNIPKAVLAWAKGQQEADVVDYVVVSDNAEYNNLNSQDNQTGESEVNKVRAEVMDYAVKSKKAQEDITNKREKTSELTDKAEYIAKKENDIFKNNSIDKTEEMANEWKALDKKKKEEGKLNQVDNAKYKKLADKLNKNGEIIKELKLNSAELDDFLVSIDNLNTESTEGLLTAQNAISAASNLSQLDERINIFDRVHAYKIAATNSSLLGDELNNVNDYQLAFVTDKIAHDLEDIGIDTIDSITADETQEVVTFASTYVSRATHIEQILGINDDSSDTEESDQQEEEFQGSNTLARNLNDMFEAGKESSYDNPFGFLLSFMSTPQVALLAAATTILSSGYTIAEATALSAERIVLGKNIKKAEEEDKKLETEAEKSVETFGKNSLKIEDNNAKIASIEEKITQNQNAEADFVPEADDSDNPDDLRILDGKNKSANEAEGEQNSPLIAEKIAINSENEQYIAANEVLQKKIEMPLEKSANLLEKNKKSISKVDSQSQVLDADIDELLKLSANTLESGVANAAAGATNALIASALMAEGIALLSHFNPYGAYLCNIATVWLAISATQIAASPVAVGGAAVGVAGAATSKLEYELADSLSKESKVETKETQQLIIETAKGMGDLDVSQVVDQDDTIGLQQNQSNIVVSNEQGSEDDDPTLINNSSLLSNNENEENIVTEGNAEDNTPVSNPDVIQSDEGDVQENETEETQDSVENSDLPKHRSLSSQQSVVSSDIPEEDLKDHVVKGVAMGQQPETVAFSYINSRIMSGAIKPNEDEEINIKQTNRKQSAKNDETTKAEDKKDKNADPQAALKDAYGPNMDFTLAFIGVEVAAIVALGPTAFAMQLLVWGGIVGASVADLFYKKGVVDKSSEVADKDVQNSADAMKNIEAKSKQILSVHNQNMAKAKALSNDYRSLNDDSVNYQFEMEQNQAKLVESGKLNPEDVSADTLDPNAAAKAAIRANISKMSEKDSKLLKTLDEPMSNSQKINKQSTKSVYGFEELNDKLSDRNSNNNLLGDLIIGDVAIAQGLIVALMAVLAIGGMFSSGLLAAWALNLAKSVALAATGVAAKVVSNKVDGSIDANSQDISTDKKSLLNDDKKRLDVRKAMAKAGLEKMGNLPPEKSEQNQTTQNQTQNSNVQEDENLSQDENQNNNPLNNNLSLSYVSKDKDIESDFDNSSLNAELDINKPEDLKIANQYAAAFTRIKNRADENSIAAAGSNTDASSKSDTTDKADVKLARFNKSGAISSKKKSQKVNAAAASHNGRKRR